MHAVNRIQPGWVLGCLSLLIMAGCSDERVSRGARPVMARGESASRRIANADLANVRSVAAKAFRQRFRLDPDESSGTIMISHPLEVTGKQGPGRVRDVLGRPNRYRQVATMRLSQEGSDTLVQCQVRIQRLDTVERAAFARERGDDRPTDTPIDRSGATSTETRDDWVPVGRDRQTEAEILDQIVRLLGQDTVESGDN